MWKLHSELRKYSFEQRLQCDLNWVFPGVYQHLVLNLIRNTTQTQQTTTPFQHLGRKRFAWSRGAALGRQTCREKRMAMVCHTAHSHRAIPGSTKPWKKLLCFNCANPRGWWEVQGWLFLLVRILKLVLCCILFLWKCLMVEICCVWNPLFPTPSGNSFAVCRA